MDYSQITSALFVGTTPRREDYAALRQLGVGLVINLRLRPPVSDRHQPPIPILWLPVFDFPLFPIPVRTLQRGVQAALHAFAMGQRVYAHCARGAHRSVAMATCILISQGQAPEQAMQLIRERRQIADPGIWYIHRQIQRFARAFQFVEDPANQP